MPFWIISVSGKAVSRVINRGLKKIRPWQLSKFLVELFPTVDAAGHSDAMDSKLRHRLDSVLFQEFRSEPFRSPAAGVQATQLSGFRITIDYEQVAAHAVHQGLNHLQNRVGGNRRIHSGTTARQYLRARLRSQCLACCNYPARRNHHRTRLCAIGC